MLRWLLSSLQCALTAPEMWPVWPALRVAVWWTVITLVALPMGWIAGTAIAIVLLCHVLLVSRASRGSTVRLSVLFVGWLLFINAYWMIAELISPAAGAARAAQ